MFRNFALTALLIVAVASVPVRADQPPVSASARPAEIPTEAFTSRSQFYSPRLSPSGTRFAFVTYDGNQTILAIHDASTLEPLQAVALGDREQFKFYRWAGDNRILISRRERLSAVSVGIATRLSLFDLESREFSFVGFEDQASEGDDILHVDPDGRHIILSLSRERYKPPLAWRFPLDGQGAANAVVVQNTHRDIREWWADNEGVVRIGWSWTSKADIKIYYRSGPEEKFKLVTRVKGGDEAGLDAWDVLGLYAGSDIGYALVDTEDGRTVLREIDYARGKLGEIIYENPRWSIDRAIFRPGGKPVGVYFTDDEPQALWFDPELARTQEMLEAALPGSRVRILDFAGSERMLVLQTGNNDPGALYVYTPREMRLDLFANLRPAIDESTLSESLTFDIPARDGAQMRSYLTVPRGRQAKGLPLIVMPHGGPYGVRDTLAYDDWTQLLANRGYAVLRVNYRGSGGFGEDFERLGDGEIGRAMQDDLDDATDWAIAQGYAAPGRVCLFGASYGGYASMWGAIRNPERYRCGASFAGVTDWGNLLEYDNEYLGRGRIRGRWYEDVWTPRITGEDDFDLTRVSVVHQIGRLKVPLFVAHGTADLRVPFNQFEMLQESAEGKNLDITFLKLSDDHYLRSAYQEMRLLDGLLAFLDEHNPAYLQQ